MNLFQCSRERKCKRANGDGFFSRHSNGDGIFKRDRFRGELVPTEAELARAEGRTGLLRYYYRRAA